MINCHSKYYIARYTLIRGFWFGMGRWSNVGVRLPFRAGVSARSGLTSQCEGLESASSNLRCGQANICLAKILLGQIAHLGRGDELAKVRVGAKTLLNRIRAIVRHDHIELQEHPLLVEEFGHL